MSIVKPINTYKQKQVVDETQKYLKLASDIFHHPLKPINILFNLNGMASGMFLVKQGTPVIRYNPYIFAKHFSYSISNTVPHEVAHYAIYSLFGLKRVRPHGKEWKDLMRKFGAQPISTNTLNLDGIPTRQHKRHQYSCNCSKHLITSRRHNKIADRRVKYFCRACGGELQPSA
jgi:SprT protein